MNNKYIFFFIYLFRSFNFTKSNELEEEYSTLEQNNIVNADERKTRLTFLQNHKEEIVGCGALIILGGFSTYGYAHDWFSSKNGKEISKTDNKTNKPLPVIKTEAIESDQETGASTKTPTTSQNPTPTAPNPAPTTPQNPANPTPTPPQNPTPTGPKPVPNPAPNPKTPITPPVPPVHTPILTPGEKEKLFKEDVEKIKDILYNDPNQQWQYKILDDQGESNDLNDSYLTTKITDISDFRYNNIETNDEDNSDLYGTFMAFSFDPKKLSIKNVIKPNFTIQDIEKLQNNKRFKNILEDLKGYSISIYQSGLGYGRARTTGEYIRIDENPNMYLELLKACIKNEKYDYIFFDRLVLVYELLKNLIAKADSSSLDPEQFHSIMTIMTTTSGLLSSLFNYRHFNIITNDQGDQEYEDPLKNFTITNHQWDFSAINDLDKLNNSSSVLLYLLMQSDASSISDPTLTKVVEYWPTLLTIIISRKIHNGTDFLKGWVFMMSKLNNCTTILNFVNDVKASDDITKFSSTQIQNTDFNFKDEKNKIIATIIDNLLTLDSNMSTQPLKEQGYAMDIFINKTKPCPMTLKASYIASVSNNFIMFGSGENDGIIGVYPFAELETIETDNMINKQDSSRIDIIQQYLENNCFKILDKLKDSSGLYVWK